MNSPFFSIIIPTHNRANLISVAINSVLNQTFQDFEIIVVDDGSKDNTEEVVKSIKDRRIRYYKKENEERSIARNFGIDNVIGKYIGFLDADDYALTIHLETAFENIQKCDANSIIHLGYKIENTNGKVITQVTNLNESSIDSLPFENRLNCNAIFIPSHIIKKYKFLNSKYATISEDRYLWIILASRFEFHFVPEITSVTVEHDERSLNTLNAQKVMQSFNVIFKHLLKDKEARKKYGKNLNYFASNQYLFCSNISLANKKYFLALTCMFKSFLFQPITTLQRINASLLKRL